MQFVWVDWFDQEVDDFCFQCCLLDWFVIDYGDQDYWNVVVFGQVMEMMGEFQFIYFWYVVIEQQQVDWMGFVLG